MSTSSYTLCLLSLTWYILHNRACIMLIHGYTDEDMSLEVYTQLLSYAFVYTIAPCIYIVGGIMVLCVTHLYRPVLTLRTYHCHYESGIPPLTCFFDQNPGNSFSTCPPNYSVIIS